MDFSMNPLDDRRAPRAYPRRPQLAGLTLAELLVVGHDLRRRSERVFQDMAALEEQLRRHLPHDPARRA
jgi:hypothetical protein